MAATDEIPPSPSADPVASDARPTERPSTRRAGLPKRWTVMIAVVVVAALIAVGALWRGRGTESAAPSVTSDVPPTLLIGPTLQHEIEVTAKAYGLSGDPVFGGTANDLYVAESASLTSFTVSRFVDGELQWKSGPHEGANATLETAGGDVIVEATRAEDRVSYVARVEPADGSFSWTRELAATAAGAPSESFVRFDDRFYLVTSGGEAANVVTELDPSTGQELESISGEYVVPIDAGFALVDADDSTVQLVDADLQPVGDRVTIEHSGDPVFPWIVDRTDNIWVYFSGSRLVGRSDDGDSAFECPVTLEQTWAVDVIDNATVFVWSLGEVEVFEVGESGCARRWSAKNQIADTEGPFVVSFNGPFDPSQTKDSVDVIDWETGSVVATGEGEVFLTDDGRMITFDGDEIVAIEVESGDERWRLDAPAPSRFEVVGDLLIVMNYNDDQSAATHIYSD